MDKRPEMMERAFEVAQESYEKCNTEQEMSTFIKKAFEKEFGHT